MYLNGLRKIKIFQMKKPFVNEYFARLKNE